MPVPESDSSSRLVCAIGVRIELPPPPLSEEQLAAWDPEKPLPEALEIAWLRFIAEPGNRDPRTWKLEEVRGVEGILKEFASFVGGDPQILIDPFGRSYFDGKGIKAESSVAFFKNCVERIAQKRFPESYFKTPEPTQEDLRPPEKTP